MSDPKEIDAELVENLALEHLRIIRKHYLERGLEGPAVYENLNALALAVAMIFAGTDFDDAVARFFSDAVSLQITAEYTRRNQKKFDEIWPDEFPADADNVVDINAVAARVRKILRGGDD
jgi:hypothetical protein